MDRGVWWGTVHGVTATNTTTSGMTEKYPIIHLTMTVLKNPSVNESHLDFFSMFLI